MKSQSMPAVSAKLDRQFINEEGKSVRFIVVQVHAPKLEKQAGPRTPLNLAMVIDASGSMSGGPIEAAKTATASVIRRLKSDDRLSIVSFADDVQVHCDAITQDAEGRTLAASRVAAVSTRGSTDLAAGWLGGCECVARVMEAEPRMRNRVVLLSDGHANHGVIDPATLERHAAELRTRGIMSSTVGIGVNYSPAQLQAIAEQGGGRMHDAEQPEEIIEILLAELEEVTMTALENVEILLELAPGVEVEPVGGLPCSRDAGMLRTVVGAMISEAGRTVVFKVTTPAGAAGQVTAVTVAAAWRWPGETQTQTQACGAVEFTFATMKQCESQARDNRVSLEVARMWQMAIVRRTIALNTDGAYEAAERYAREENKWFARYCRDLPGAAEFLEPLERLAGASSMAMHSVTSKEMMLDSYKSIRGETDKRSKKRGSWDEHLKP